MPPTFHCPLLDGVVELTDEREAHIRERHPDLLPEYVDELERTIEQPDELLPAVAGASQLLVPYVATIRGGRYLVAVVATDAGAPPRLWLVTAYLTRRSPETP